MDYSNVPFLKRVDTVLSWIDLPADKRPDFITLYFDEPDHEGHSYGPDDIVKVHVHIRPLFNMFYNTMYRYMIKTVINH